MIRRSCCIGLLTLIMSASSADLLAQSSSSDPRTRRAYRERAVAIVGPEGRDFIETFGEDAVAATFAVSKPVALQLARFSNSGKLGKLPRPGDLLRLIAKPRHGDDVARYAMLHSDELVDVDNFNTFLARPLDYAMELRDLETGAAASRANRLDPEEPPTKPWVAKVSSVMNDDTLGMTACAAFVILLAFALWRRKRASIDS